MAWGLFSRKTINPPSTALEERLESVERKVRQLELEWAETYDKINRLMHRITKRVQADNKPDLQDEQRPPTVDPHDPLHQAAALAQFRRRR